MFPRFVCHHLPVSFSRCLSFTFPIFFLFVSLTFLCHPIVFHCLLYDFPMPSIAILLFPLAFHLCPLCFLCLCASFLLFFIVRDCISCVFSHVFYMTSLSNGFPLHSYWFCLFLIYFHCISYVFLWASFIFDCLSLHFLWFGIIGKEVTAQYTPIALQ